MKPVAPWTRFINRSHVGTLSARIRGIYNQTRWNVSAARTQHFCRITEKPFSFYPTDSQLDARDARVHSSTFKLSRYLVIRRSSKYIRCYFLRNVKVFERKGTEKYGGQKETENEETGNQRRNKSDHRVCVRLCFRRSNLRMFIAPEEPKLEIVRL